MNPHPLPKSIWASVISDGKENTLPAIPEDDKKKWLAGPDSAYV